MADQWFAPHAAGFGPLVARLVRRDYPGCVPTADGDNAIRLDLGPNSPPRSVPRGVLAYCRGLFRILAEATGGLERAALEIARDPRAESAVASRGRPEPVDGSCSRGSPTFVLRTFGPDDPASLPRDSRAALEELIIRRSGYRPDSERPQREFRLQERSDGTTLFLERAAGTGESAQRVRAGELPGNSLRRGELPRTTCRLLAEMTEPKAGDVFMDPFCGYGGIALERALAAPYRFIFVSDHEPEKIAAVKEAMTDGAFWRRRRTIFPKVRDALDPNAFDERFASAIATDPPWGLYEGGPDEADVRDLLCGFFFEAARVLAPHGRLVVLTARGTGDDPWCEVVRPYFRLRERLDVLVSGKKAKVLRYERGE